MSNYAIHDGHTVINVISCESKEIAESITGLQALETNGEPWIDWIYIDSKWLPPKPYPSWILDNNQWVAPVKAPENGSWRWNEDSLSWQELNLDN